MLDEILLYEANDSPSGLQARICLQLKGIPFRRLAMRFAGLRALGRTDALGELPVLVQGTDVIAGARSIVHHLEQRHPDPGLIPADVAARAYVLLLEDWADEALGVLVGALRWLDPDNRSATEEARGRWLRPFVSRVLARRAWRRYAAASWTPASLGLVRERVRDSLELVTELLDGKPFLLGRTPTLADVAVFAQLATLARCEGQLLAGAPTVDAWVRRLGAVPPIAAALSP
jgi:glutathione S-transferase